MKLGQTATVKSLDRGLDILEYVAGCPEPPSFSQLLTSLRIPRSSLFHLLTNLLSRNFLERDPQSERYRLGAEVVAIARKVKRPSLRDRVAPLLHQLSQEVSETCGFYVRVGIGGSGRFRNQHAGAVVHHEGRHECAAIRRIRG